MLRPISLAVFVGIGMMSCSSTTETPEEIEYRRAMAFENWELCKKVLRQHNIVIWHIGHTEKEDKRYWNVKTDLANNKCRMILGDYYAR